MRSYPCDAGFDPPKLLAFWFGGVGGLRLNLCLVGALVSLAESMMVRNSYALRRLYSKCLTCSGDALDVKDFMARGR